MMIKIERGLSVKVTKPLPTGRQAFRDSVTVTFKELKTTDVASFRRYGDRYRCR